ncbi:MAG TPA: pyridoxal phosphate-dependent aminotransferase [Thermoanaerobaculia bacterium]|jgi:aspartate aminotransferase|nr:pyridoxal phosphate-dependent aminotransferase [Thermoanaerobaculia bacterium]
MPNISKRGQAVPASPIRRLMPVAEQAKKRGIHVYHLNIGQPDLETPPAMRERLRLLEKEKVYAYTPSGGTPEFLGSLQKYYAGFGIALSLDQILATTGGSEAILFAMLACAGQGDEVLVVEPFYTNYNAFAAMAGVRLVPLRTRVEDGFHLPPLEAWEKALTPKTRAVLLCNPNNPTGTVYGREEMDMVAGFCRDHGLFLISDEVYREFVYDGRRPSSALELSGFEDLVVVVDSLSKRYSACGIRLGCLATRNRDVFGACLRMAQGRLSPPGLAQFVASGASDLPADYTRDVVAEYQKRRDVLYRGLKSLPGVFLAKPEGAFYFVARLPIESGDDFASWMLSDFSLGGATVMVAPAAGFYGTAGLGSDEVRIAYVLNAADLEASVKILASGLEKYAAVRGPCAATEAVEPVGAAAGGPDFTPTGT